MDLWKADAMPRMPVMIAAGQFVITPVEGRIRIAGIVAIGGPRPPLRRIL